MKTDPLIRAMRKARASSPVGQLEALFKERNKWQRRKTIASNKLRDVFYKIETFAADLAKKASSNDNKS